MMKRLAMALLLTALWGAPRAFAASATITTNASTCALTTTCLVVNLPQDKGGATLTLSGTWTGTISFEATGDGGATWVAVSVTPLASSTTVTSSTGNGSWQVNVSGFTGLRMRGSATMSGSAIATITPSAASARGGAASGGGGGGTVTSIATTSPIGGGTITSTGTITCTTCVVASSPGAGLAKFAGSTQTVTSVSSNRAIAFQLGIPGGSSLSTGILSYVTIPFACTITGWSIEADAGTATVKFLKVAAGTAIPTLGSNSISTSGVALSTGTVIQSTTLTDFTTTTVTANDIMAADMITTSGVGFINAQVICAQ